MASMTMTASFLAGSASNITTKQPLTSGRRGLIVVRASRERVNMETSKNVEENNNSMRRELVFAAAAAAAAACSIAKVALADEPKSGTPEAKKKYAPICVTMPTARICRK